MLINRILLKFNRLLIKSPKSNSRKTNFKPRFTLLFVIAFILGLLPLVYTATNKPKQVEAAWYSTSWGYRRLLTIDYNQVSGGADLTNFPVLVSITADPSISANTQSDGDDILFTDFNGTKLDHEIESYGSGTLVAFVEVPTVSASSNTQFFLYYGNPTASSQQNATGVWDSNYVMVQHMSEASGTFSDSTSNNNDSSSVSNLTYAATCKIAKCPTWNGTTSILNVADSASLDLTTNLTIEAWIYMVTYGEGNEPSIVDKNLASAYAFYADNVTTSHSLTFEATGTVGQNNASNNVVSLGGWHHVAVKYNSTTMTFFANGGSAGSASDTATLGVNATGLRIGSDTAGGFTMDGNIDEVRISNSARTDGWITTGYRNQSAPNTFVQAGQIETYTNRTAYSFWKFDEGIDNKCSGGSNDACDGSSMRNDLARTNAVWKTPELCMSGNCFYFDGSGDYLSRSDDNDFDFVAADSFSISGWFRHPTIATNPDYLVTKHNATAGGYKIYMDSDGDLVFGIDDDSTWDTTDIVGDDQSKNFDDNNWHSFTAVKNGTTGIYLYVDGYLVDSDASLVETGTLANANTLYIGIDGNGSSNGWEGFVDEIKFYDYVRSASQVITDANPVGSVKGISASLGNQDTSLLSEGLVGYWKMDETSWTVDCSTTSVTDSSGNSKNGRACPTTTGPSGGSAGKFGPAGNLDGTNDYVEITSPILPTGDFTYSTWIKLDTTTDENIVSILDGSGVDELSLRVTSGVLTVNVNGSEVVTGTISLSASTWYHIVATRQGSNVYGYINGVAESDIGSESSTLSFSTCSILLGADADTTCTGSLGNYYDGVIDDFRIYNRALSPAEVNNLYTWGPSPVVYYKFDENTGTSTAYDSGSAGLNGTLNSVLGSDWQPGKFGSSLTFDDSAKRVSVTDNAILDLNASQGYTWCAWINPGDFTADDWHTVWSQDEDTLNNFYIYAGTLVNEFWGPVTQGVSVGWFDGGSTNFTQRSTPDNVLSLNTWAHVCATYNPLLTQANRFNIYINGEDKTDLTDSTDQSAGTIGNITVANTQVAANAAFGEYFSGKIDEVKYYNYVRTQAQIIQDMNGGHPIGGSPISSHLVHWSFDEGQGTTANNRGSALSSNGTLTSIAAPATSTSGWTYSGKLNKAIVFDGSDDKVVLATASDTAVDFNSTEQFSMSGWIYPTTVPTSTTEEDLIIGKWDQTSTQRAYRIFLENDDTDSTGNIRVEVYDESADQTLSVQTANDYISQNTWYHVAFSFNGGTAGAAGDLVLYVNGNRVGSNSANASFLGIEDMTSDFTVGDYDATDATAALTGFTGRIDEVKVYSGVIATSDVAIDMANGGGANITYSQSSANEESTVTGGLGTAPVLIWNLDENTSTSAKDTSGNENTGTLTNTPVWEQGKFGSGVTFAGSNQHITRADDTDLDFAASTSFTLETWFKHNTASATETLVSKLEASGTDGGYKLKMESDGDITCETDDDDADTTIDDTATTTAATYDDNAWHHVACVYDVTNTDIYIYIDGILVATDSSTTTNTLANDDAFFYGIESATGSEDWIGSLDNLVIYNYARSGAQIAYDYNRGVPLAWWRLDECTGSNSYDSSGKSNTGTITIGATGSQTSTGTCSSGTSTQAWNNGTTGKLNYSLSLDGTDDYVDYGDVANLTGDFSIAMWIYPDSLDVGASMFNGFLSKRETFAGMAWEFFYNGHVAGGSVGVAFIYGNSAANAIYFGKTLSTSTWQHLTLTRSGNTFTLYVNGLSAASTTSSGTIPSGNTENVCLGTLQCAISGADNYFDGQIDDVRIYNYALTQAQINAVINNGAASFAPASGAP